MTSTRAVSAPSRSVPPHLYFVGSAIFHYLGPAFAVLLFAHVDVLGAAWLRIASAAVIFAAWRRPWRIWRRLDRRARPVLVAWGSVLAVMNSCFYVAIDRLPLGTVAAIEFLPVIVLAAVAVRSARNVIALLAAVAGVYLLADGHLAAGILPANSATHAMPVGLVFAGANAVLFAAYIVLGHRVAQSRAVSGIDGLASAMIIAALVAAPVGFGDAVAAFGDVTLLAAAIGVGVCSSVVPYVCDQLAMARLARGTYALLVSILPAAATVIGVIVLAQVPSFLELAGVAAVIVGVAVHREYDGDVRV